MIEIDIVSAMDQLAAETWRKLDQGDRSGLKFREDSITEHNLLELHLRYPQLNVHRFNQVEEKEEGADWEWWIGNYAEGWVCLRIQAKRAHGTVYRYLSHEGDAPGDYQYDTLINQCDLDAAEYPFHVFYNGWGDTPFGIEANAAIKISPHWLPALGYRISDWGCAALSSYRVAALHSPGGRHRSHVPRYLEAAMPWSEFFLNSRGRTYAASRSVSVVDTVHASAHEATLRAQPGSDESSVSEAMGVFEREGAGLRRRELPPYARAVRGGDVREFFDLRVPTSLVSVLETPVPETTQQVTVAPSIL